MRWLKNSAAAVLLVLAAITGYEGFSSTSYQDGAGVWTNGYGNTAGVTAHTPPVSTATAEQQLKVTVSKNAAAIDKYLTRPATVGQSAAYQSLAYNIGVYAFGRSSIVRKHNAGDFQGACNAILLYNKIRIRGVLTVSPGLVARRQQERELCLMKDQDVQ